jgi:glycosyltransferase involved in cell wall biosynthesis
MPMCINLFFNRLSTCLMTRHEYCQRDEIPMKGLCIIGDVPPPYSGPEIGVEKMLRSTLLIERFRLVNFSFGMNKSNVSRGLVNVKKILRFLFKLIRLYHQLSDPSICVVYYYFSQTRLGFIKDAVVVIIARARRKKVVLHSRGGNFKSFYFKQPTYLKFAISRMLGLSQLLLVQSGCLKAQIEVAAPNKKIGIFHNGLERTEIWNERTYENKNCLNILFIGLLSFSKGFYDLICTIPSVIDKHPEAKFYFAGEMIALSSDRNIRPIDFISSDRIKELSSMAVRVMAEFSNNIKFTGVVRGDEKKELLKQCDIFALPSYSEGLSRSVLEAMGYGLPIITTPVGANLDIFDDAQESLVAHGDVAALSEKISLFLGDSKLREKLGKRNLKIAKERYCDEKITKQFADVIESIL